MKKITALLVLISFFSIDLYSQKKPKDAPINWDKYDVNNENKIDGKGKPFKKMLEGKNFLANFSIQQVTEAKGQLSNKEKFRSNTQIKSFVTLSGVSSEKYQQLVDKLYADFVQKMSAMGIEFVDGSEVINHEFIKDKSKNDNVYVGHSPIVPTDYSLKNAAGADMYFGEPTGASQRAASFHPSDYNYVIDARVIGNGYYKMAPKTKHNFVIVSYALTFADFESGANTQRSSLQTSPLITVTPKIGVVNEDGAFNWVTYGSFIFGNRNWLSAEGITEGGTHKNILGNQVKDGYVMNADEDKYINELTSMLMKVQESMLAYVKSQM